MRRRVPFALPVAMLAALAFPSSAQNEVLKPFRPGKPTVEEPQPAMPLKPFRPGATEEAPKDAPVKPAEGTPVPEEPEIPRAKPLGSKLGRLASTSTSPLDGSIATIAPRRPANSRARRSSFAAIVQSFAPVAADTRRQLGFSSFREMRVAIWRLTYSGVFLALAVVAAGIAPASAQTPPREVLLGVSKISRPAAIVATPEHDAAYLYDVATAKVLG